MDKTAATGHEEDLPPGVPPPVSPDVQKEMAVRWGIGCLVGSVALVGVLLLSALVSFYLQPPPWVQIALGVLLVLGAVVLAWLVATAWGRSTPPGGARRADGTGAAPHDSR